MKQQDSSQNDMDKDLQMQSETSTEPKYSEGEAHAIAEAAIQRAFGKAAKELGIELRKN